jgi:small-conductance mechanosensitive channel
MLGSRFFEPKPAGEGLDPKSVDELVRDVRELGFGKNTPLEWLTALAVFIGVWAALATLHALVAVALRRLERKRPSRALSALRDATAATRWFFFATIALYFASDFVQVRGSVESVARAFVLIALFGQVGLWLQTIVHGAVSFWAARQDSAHRATVAGGVQFISRLAIWGIVVLLVLSNLGVELSALVAGLGVGGVAAALAVQGLLGDMFAGLAMYFDRPFDIGQFVAVDTLEGRVTRIGLRTTRLRSIDGEEIVLPNGDLAKARILNFDRMKERRIVFRFGIEYGVSSETLEKARRITEEVINGTENVRVQRVHFRDFAAEWLEFEVAYFVLSAEPLVWMDVRHRINVELYRRFEEEDVPFATPAQTIHLKYDRRSKGSPPLPPSDEAMTDMH